MPRAARSRGSASSRRLPLLVGVVGLVAVGVVLWRVADRDLPSTGPVEIAHVHGLGVNPADDSLYVATHFGLFRLDGDGDAERVGRSAQDTMGFTVAGPDRFLASGHPDLSIRPRRLDERPLLGLIESVDSGRSWRALSLTGEADFHALVAAHGRVYGWNATSGDLMVTTDGRTWETRSQVALLSFSVDAGDPDRLLASGTDGVSASTDGGRSWEQVGGPANAYLAADDTTTWAAGAEDGEILRSRDGRSWERFGTLPGPAEALLAHGGRLYAAAGEAGIVVSENGGRSWRTLYRPPQG